MDLLRDFDIAVPIYKVATDPDGAHEIAAEFGVYFMHVDCRNNYHATMAASTHTHTIMQKKTHKNIQRILKQYSLGNQSYKCSF